MQTQAVYVGKNTVLFRNSLGQKMYVDSRDVGIGAHLLLDGNWEYWISNAMQPSMKNAVFVDVGANFGWFTMLAAKSGARRLIAFEPNPHLFSLMKKSLLVNGIKAELHGVAVDQKASRVSLDVCWEWSGGGSALYPINEVDETFEVDSHPLDSALAHVLEEEDVKTPWLLKIDVEGFEPRVVLGAQKLLTTRQCTAFVEYHSDPKGHSKLVEMLDFFDQHKYQMSLVQHDQKIVRISRANLAQVGEAEMLCFRRFAR